MSTKTTFKRIALVAVAALGLGVLSVAPSSATVSDETLTITGASTTSTVNDSASATITNTFFATAANTDSRAVRATVVGPGTASVYFRPTSDSANTMTALNTRWSASETAAAKVANANVKQTYSLSVQGFSAAGTYTITVFTQDVQSGVYTTAKNASFNVTVAAENTTATGVNSYITTDAATAWFWKSNMATSMDSAVVVDRGASLAYASAATVFMNVKNSAGETTTALGTNICKDTCTVTVQLVGPGAVVGGTPATPTTSNAMKTATIYVHNRSAGWGYGETLTVYSDGVAGTGTLNYYLGSTLLGSNSITFSGPVASISQVYFSDTSVVIGQSSVKIYAKALDSAGTVNGTGPLYLYATDTKVVTGAVKTADTYTVNTNTGTYDATTGLWSWTITAADTGTSTLTIRDSRTVALSTVSSAGIDMTVTGVGAKSLTVAFDKATYAPGEKAIITITGKDAADRLIATSSSLVTGFSVLSTPTLTYVGTAAAGCGTQCTTSPTESILQSYLDSGVETRVVTMPTFGTSVSYAVTFTPQLSTTPVTVKATATVADPTKDAADAATDAALEATDAAYAAQDAAQLAAEAADAATAAAEAATAAVEDLATQVASLFADLQKQITTLANVVAKIAKKVKA